MKKIVSITIFVLLPILLFGQEYKTDFIISTADSLMKRELGDSLFIYAKYDKDTYYEYKSKRGKTQWEVLNKYKKTKGKFVKTNVRWFLEIPFPNCPEFGIIKGWTSISLDSLLNQIRKPYLEFIPDIFWTREKCELIPKETAIKIAKSQILKQGIEPLSVKLKYETKEKIFIWEVSNYLTRMQIIKNYDSGQVEIVKINASTGQIINHDIYIYGPII